MTYDYSTINLDALRKLPRVTLAQTYRLQDTLGGGCAGDPPGYPSYFTQHVYTQYGNSPGRGSTEVVKDPETGALYEVMNARDQFEVRRSRLRALYVPLPLPIEHLRTQAWIRATFQHLRHCYLDVERPEYGRPGTLIYPVPDYKLQTFTDDVRWSDEYRTAKRAEVAAFNRQERERAAGLATLDNHQAVCRIREVYPEFAVGAEPLLATVVEEAWTRGEGPGDWWQREAAQPTVEACEYRNRPNAWGSDARKHRTEGWCQYCGRTDATLPATVPA